MVAGFSAIATVYYLAFGRKTFRGPGGMQEPIALDETPSSEDKVYKSEDRSSPGVAILPVDAV